MRYLLLFVLVITINTSKAQCGTLTSHGAIPIPLYDTSFAYVNLQVYCNEMISLQNYTVTPSGNSFMIDAFYCYGWLQVIHTTNDSIPLGVLPAGSYTYTVNIYNSYAPVTNCMAFSTSDQDAGSFNVLPVTNTIEQAIESNLHFYPNPNNGTITLENSIEISTVTLFTIDGKQVYFTDEINETLTLSDLAAGVYFIQAEMKDGSATKPQQLVLTK